MAVAFLGMVLMTSASVLTSMTVCSPRCLAANGSYLTIPRKAAAVAETSMKKYQGSVLIVLLVYLRLYLWVYSKILYSQFIVWGRKVCWSVWHFTGCGPESVSTLNSPSSSSGVFMVWHRATYPTTYVASPSPTIVGLTDCTTNVAVDHGRPHFSGCRQ